MYHAMLSQRRLLQKIFFAVALALVIAGVAWGVYTAILFFTRQDTYQAVFLDNNQVYFGKVNHPKADVRHAYQCLLLSAESSCGGRSG